MKLIYVGAYELGDFKTILFLDPSTSSARYDYATGKGILPKITLGFSKPFDDWEDLIELLLHESFEACCVNNDLRYELKGNHSSQDCLFVFAHDKFNRVCRQQARFVAAALPDLFKKFKKLRPEKAD